MKIKHTIYFLSTTALTFGCGYSQKLGMYRSKATSSSASSFTDSSSASSYTELILRCEEDEFLNELKLLQKANQDRVHLQKVLNKKGPDGMTPLMCCAYSDFRAGLQNLLDLGVHPAIQDLNGNTFLHHFIHKGQYVQLKTALEHFSKDYTSAYLQNLLEQPNEAGKTPLGLLDDMTDDFSAKLRDALAVVYNQ